MSAAPIVWARTPADFAAGARATAWVVALDDPLLSALGAPSPHARDLADISYPGAGPRDRFLERRMALRALVGARLATPADAVVIAYREGGAPYIAAPAYSGLHVSLAGRDGLAGFAIADSPAGVDFEPLDASVAVLPAMLHPSEAARLEALPSPDRARAFLRIWTIKEAYLKALGTGLRRDPAEVAVAEARARGAAINDQGRDIACAAGWDEIVVGSRTIIAACVTLNT